MQKYRSVTGETPALTQAPKCLPAATYHGGDCSFCSFSLGHVLVRFSCRLIAKHLCSGDCEAFATGRNYLRAACLSACICFFATLAELARIRPHENSSTVQVDISLLSCRSIFHLKDSHSLCRRARKHWSCPLCSMAKSFAREAQCTRLEWLLLSIAYVSTCKQGRTLLRV